MKYLTRTLCLLMALVICGVSTARAHFVWVEVVDTAGNTQLVRVAFSEAGEAGAAYLVDRIAHAKATAFAGETSQALPLEPSLCNETGWLTTELESPTNRVQLDCKYGIFARGETAALLHYYASFEQASFATLNAENKSDAAEMLTLQVRPAGTADELRFNIFWQGKPLSDSEAVVISPDGTEATITSNQEGAVLVSDPQSGIYRVRARHVVEQAGTEDGESYEEELHYSTLTLRLAESESEDTSTALTAAELLAKARAGRAVWANFPGFTADVTIYESGEQQTGVITVDANGALEFQGVQLGEDSRVEATLRSLIAHRMGSGAADDDVSYADEDVHHPLGRLVNLEYDTSMGSSYRVQGDVIREVNRSMGGGHFTITVLDVYRNPKGAYLPSHYVMNSWDQDDNLRSSTAVRDEWVRVGPFDLPRSHTSVASGAGSSTELQIKFSNHKLNETTGQ